jgi:WhiB family redox-sensing transcriptional regulator
MRTCGHIATYQSGCHCDDCRRAAREARSRMRASGTQQQTGHPIIRNLPPQDDWIRNAACRGMNPELWFNEARGGSYREGRLICAGCPVRRECLEWAVDTRTDHGLFGGLNPLERRHLRRGPRP